MEDCIFCKIIKKEIPSALIYEDKHTLAFLSIGPSAEGHTLVIPKSHYENFLDIPDEIMPFLSSTIKKTAKALMKNGATGFNIGMNNFKDGGQEIMHAHFHIIPRMKNDKLFPWGQHDKTYEVNDLKDFSEKIKSLLK